MGDSGTWSGLLITSAVAFVIGAGCVAASAPLARRYPYISCSRRWSATRQLGADGRISTLIRSTDLGGDTANREANNLHASTRRFYLLRDSLGWATRHSLYIPCCRRTPQITSAQVDIDLLNAHGGSPDAYLFDVWLRICFTWSLVALGLAVPVSLVNAVAGGRPVTDPLYLLASERVGWGSGLLWVHFGAVTVSTAALLALLHSGYREYYRARLAWLSRLTPASHTVMLVGLPSRAPPVAAPNAGSTFGEPRAPAYHPATVRSGDGTTAPALIAHFPYSRDLLRALRKQERVGREIGRVGVMAEAYARSTAAHAQRSPEAERRRGSGASLLPPGPGPQPVAAPSTVASHGIKDATYRPRSIGPGNAFTRAVACRRNPQLSFADALSALRTAHEELAQRIASLRAGIDAVAVSCQVGVGDLPSTLPLPPPHLTVADTAFVTYARASHASQMVAAGRAAFLGPVPPAPVDTVAHACPLPSGARPSTAAELAAGPTCTVRPAPAPEEVVWANVFLTRGQRNARWAAAVVLTALVVMLAAIPALTAALLSQFAPLGYATDAFAFALGWTGLDRGLIQQTLPSLIVSLFLLLLTPILRGVGRLSGIASQGGLHLFLVRTSFAVSYLTVLLTFTFAGTALSVLQSLAQPPQALLSDLTRGLEQQSAFYTSFLIVQTLQGLLLTASCLPQLALWAWRERRGLWTQADFDRAADNARGGLSYDDYLPGSSLPLGILLLYGFLNTAILPAGPAFFATSVGVTRRRQIDMHVRPPEAQLGGAIWVQAVEQTVTVAVTAHLFWITWLVLRGRPVAGFCGAAWVAATLAARVYWWRMFEQPLVALPPHIADAIQSTFAPGGAPVPARVSFSPVSSLFLGPQDGPLRLWVQHRSRLTP